MMSLHRGLKSALLAVTAMVAVPTTQVCASQAAVSHAFLGFVSQHKLGCILAASWFAAHVDLKTKDTRDKFGLKGIKIDFQEFLDSVKDLDPAALKNFVALVRNYLIGFPVKFDNIDVPVIDESGKYKEYTIKGKKKLAQSPSGVYGNFDAYVLSQIKDFTEGHIPQFAALYALVMHPDAILKAFEKATGITISKQ